jgi:hypothetical protein
MNAGRLRIKPTFRLGIQAVLMSSIVVITGCSSMSPKVRPSPKGATPAVSVNMQMPSSPASEGGSKVTQCNNELLALKTINTAEYSRYHREMTQLVTSGQRYMNVKGEISSDINDIMTPRYQFGMANLCWKIRNALSQSLLTEVDIPQELKP